MSPDADTARLFRTELEQAVPPTVQALRAALDQTFERIRRAKATGQATRFYFYYSGHGDVVHGEGFVALDDGRLSRGDLYDAILEPSPADENHVIIDACRSYFFAFGKGPGGTRHRHHLTFRSAQERFPNTGFILSTSSDRDSHEWARFRAGVFSHEVRSALHGGADANLDGSITYAELGAFVEKANESAVNARFRLDSVIAPPTRSTVEDAVLLSWSSEPGLLVPSTASLGHMVLEDRFGVRTADAHPAAGQDLHLWSPAERPLFLRGNDGHLEYVITQEGRTDIDRQHATPQRSASRGPADRAFRRLFIVPFSQLSVEEYAQRASPVVLHTLNLEPASSPASVARAWSPWIAAGAGMLGVAMTTAGWLERRDVAQVDVAQVNDRIAIYNGVAVTSYVVAAVFAVTWSFAMHYGPGLYR